MNSRVPTRAEPIGAPSPLLKQTETLSKHAAHVAKGMPVATTAFQTAGSRRVQELQTAHRLKIGKPAKPRDPSKPQRKPYVLDSCYSWASDSEVTKRWVPQFYTGPDAEAVREAAKDKEIEMDG